MSEPNRLIIQAEGLTMEEALPYVSHVVGEGRISKGPKGGQYCYVTTWNMNPKTKEEEGRPGIVVYALRNKASDRLVVRRRAEE